MHVSLSSSALKTSLVLLVGLFCFFYSSGVLSVSSTQIKQDFSQSDYNRELSNAKERIRNAQKDLTQAEQGQRSDYHNYGSENYRPYNERRLNNIDQANRNLESAKQNLRSLESRYQSEKFERKIQKQRYQNRSQRSTLGSPVVRYHNND
jgi:hypothetical protein